MPGASAQRWAQAPFRIAVVVSAAALVTYGGLVWAAEGDEGGSGAAYTQFLTGVAKLESRLETVTRSARGVHGANYVTEVITRPTGTYIVIIVKSLSNDPKTREVCDNVRRHFLTGLTGARMPMELPEKAARLMDSLFEPTPDGRSPTAYGRELAAKASLTVALSWRKCAGWLTDWNAIH